MSYKELNKDTCEFYEERLSLVTDRLVEIIKEPGVAEPYADYFRAVSSYLLLQSFLKRYDRPMLSMHLA